MMNLQQKLGQLEKRLQRLVEGRPAAGVAEPPQPPRTAEIEDTRALPVAQPSPPPGRPAEAFLIVAGEQVFPLTQPVINIGRSTANHLVIADGRVSRQHAQLRSIGGRYILFDLEATGGTFVNGQRVAQTMLFPGDVISLAGVEIIFGGEPSIQAGATREIPLE